MNLTPALRCEIVREIRVVLVRHFIDMGRLTISISLRGIHVHGHLARLPGLPNPLTAGVVSSIIDELERIRHVKKVFAEFDNWQQKDMYGPWSEVGDTSAAAPEGPRPTPTQQTIEMADDPPPG